MAPARPRVLDDSRSETSSILTKDRSTGLAPTLTSGISKGKRVVSGTLNGIGPLSKIALSGAPTAATATSVDAADPNLPRINWLTLPTTLLHTYRQAHRLPTPAAHSHPHADLIFASSHAGLRSPASVAARQKARVKREQEDADTRMKRRAKNGNGSTTTTASSLESSRRNGGSNGTKEKEREKEKDRERSSDRLRAAVSNSTNPNPNPNNTTTTANVPTLTPSTTTPFAKQTPHQLALAVRRHFNSQQVSEGDVIAKFTYVVRHSGVGVGEDKGFRLRFRPC